MPKRLIINESERNDILFLYGLVSEQLNATKIKGRLVHELLSSGLNYKRPEKVPLPSIDVSLGRLVDGIDLKIIKTVTTNNNGEFEFTVSDVNNLIITIKGSTVAEDYEKELTSLEPNKETNLGDILLKIKDTETEIPLSSPTTSEKKDCEGYVSDDKDFYGYGRGTMKVTMNPLDESDLVKMAKKDAVKQYLLTYQESRFTYKDILNVNIKYTIACQTSDPIKNTSVVVVKIEKKVLDKIIDNLLDVKQVVVKEKIKFDDYTFKKAIEISDLRNGMPIFILFGSNSDDSTKTVLEKIEMNQELTKKLNQKYINLFYEVDRQDIDKYLSASENLNIRTYPSVVILKGIADPNKISLTDSFEIIKKEDRIADNLNVLETLFE